MSDHTNRIYSDSTKSRHRFAFWSSWRHAPNSVVSSRSDSAPNLDPLATWRLGSRVSRPA